MPRIEDLKRDFAGEWLAIEVTKEGPDWPEEGNLLVHSRDRLEVWKGWDPKTQKVYVTFAGPVVPPGYVAVF